MHALGYNLHVPLPLKLILVVVDPLLSIDVLLASQVNPRVELLYDVRVHPLDQGSELLLGLMASSQASFSLTQRSATS